MRARFNDGPYDGVTLQITDGLEHIQLPVNVTRGIALMEEKVYYCQACYRLISVNDYEARFQFESITRP